MFNCELFLVNLKWPVLVYFFRLYIAIQLPEAKQWMESTHTSFYNSNVYDPHAAGN